MNEAPNKELTNQEKQLLNIAVKKIVKKYHKALIKLAST